MIDWPEKLIEVISRRRCVVMIGSGVSQNSKNDAGKRPASWEEFLKNQLNEFDDDGLVNQLIAKKDLLSACEVIKEKLTPDNFCFNVQQEYQNAGYKPAKIHEHVYNLDTSIVATPNFDVIYDTYAQKVSRGTIKIKSHNSEDIANYIHGGQHRLLIKTHGSANDPTNIIFTRRDYAEARTKYIFFYEILKALALTHTFLFIGCGIEDPDIRMLFEDIQFAHTHLPHHYMTIPEGENHVDLIKICKRDMKINFLEYSSAKGHLELTNSLEKLVESVEKYRTDQLLSTQRW